MQQYNSWHILICDKILWAKILLYTYYYNGDDFYKITTRMIFIALLNNYKKLYNLYNSIKRATSDKKNIVRQITCALPCFLAKFSSFRRETCVSYEWVILIFSRIHKLIHHTKCEQPNICLIHKFCDKRIKTHAWEENMLWHKWC